MNKCEELHELLDIHAVDDMCRAECENLISGYLKATSKDAINETFNEKMAEAIIFASIANMDVHSWRDLARRCIERNVYFKNQERE